MNEIKMKIPEFEKIEPLTILILKVETKFIQPNKFK